MKFWRRISSLAQREFAHVNMLTIVRSTRLICLFRSRRFEPSHSVRNWPATIFLSMTASTRTRTHAQGADTPNKKRKVELDEPGDALQAASEIGERSEGLWFDDGSVVVAAKGKAFKVHRSILTRRSEVFKELLSDAAVAQLTETLEGCPILRVEDDGDDIEELFEIIYDGGNK